MSPAFNPRVHTVIVRSIPARCPDVEDVELVIVNTGGFPLPLELWVEEKKLTAP